MKDAPKLWIAWKNFAYAFQVNNDVFASHFGLKVTHALQLWCVSNLGSL